LFYFPKRQFSRGTWSQNHDPTPWWITLFRFLSNNLSLCLSHARARSLSFSLSRPFRKYDFRWGCGSCCRGALLDFCWPDSGCAPRRSPAHTHTLRERTRERETATDTHAYTSSINYTHTQTHTYTHPPIHPPHPNIIDHPHGKVVRGGGVLGRQLD